MITKAEDIIGFDQLDQIISKHFDTCLDTVDVHVQWLRFTVKGTSKRYIFRVWTQSDDRNPVYNLRRELRFLKYCEKIGYPHVLNLHSYDLNREILEYDYYIYEFVEGRDFFRVAQECTPEERETLYHNLGEVIGKMHAHRFDSPVDLVLDENEGVIVQDKQPSVYSPEQDWILHHFSQIHEYSERYPELQPMLTLPPGSLRSMQSSENNLLRP